MSKLVWDKTGEKLYETGIDHGVLYDQGSDGTYTNGTAWNGLTSINESPSGAEATDLWADNIKYLTLRSAEEFGFTIEAYMYPDEFMKYDGTVELAKGAYIGQQPRKAFGMSYRTNLGNDVDLDNHGYKLHLIYGATASPSEKSYQTVNDSPEAITFSWECNTTPVTVDDNHKPTSTIVIDSTKCDKAKLAALEAILYGSEEADARLPLPAEVASILTAA